MTALPQKTGTITSGDGIKIYYRHYPAESERARLVNTRSSTQFFESPDLEDKTLHIYENGYHEIYNEVENLQKEVFKDLENWLEKQMKPSSTR